MYKLKFIQEVSTETNVHKDVVERVVRSQWMFLMNVIQDQENGFMIQYVGKFINLKHLKQ